MHSVGGSSWPQVRDGMCFPGLAGAQKVRHYSGIHCGIKQASAASPNTHTAQHVALPALKTANPPTTYWPAAASV